ncbi:MAG: DUF493 domain-containing protein [Cyclobacteriaceae bacterium]|nr:DUF493 domain-containing protein [Cyclobacteriaceae bacterium]
METTKEKEFKELLNNQYTWPTDYLFKFIVNTEHKEELLVVLGGHRAIEKPSSKGKYVSISLRILVQSADEVMAIYTKASKVKTVMSL